jgi:hypothetical protein
MARQTNKPAKATKPAAKVSKAPAATTAVRNTPIPKAQPAAAAKVITHEMIAMRAYEISQSPACGSEMDNWCRAERELKGR